MNALRGARMVRAETVQNRTRELEPVSTGVRRAVQPSASPSRAERSLSWGVLRSTVCHEGPRMNAPERLAELLSLTREPFPASRKTYLVGSRPDLRVPVREVSLTSGTPSVSGNTRYWVPSMVLFEVT